MANPSGEDEGRDLAFSSLITASAAGTAGDPAPDWAKQVCLPESPDSNKTDE